MDGFILINKPTGPTSHDIVEDFRAISGISEVGHAGTLDPFAEGLLILLVGAFTKKSENFLKLPKTYEAVLRLGFESDSDDITGKIVETREFAIPLREDVEGALEKFRGKISQIPPKFSAIKRGGKKAYELARKGIDPDLLPREVEVFKIETAWYKFPLLSLELEVSSGTYIRAIARDLGKMLQTGAFLTQLKRTSVGGYLLEDAVDIRKLNSGNWRSFIKTSPLPEKKW
ncbi:tRNA pseudouridine(55) synthase TruB [Candidatus Giovannonibacteria bacterium]|nr:tRNA pseudouridine(55) synthase TruB [Candidatus Giovannonibacteria bacterium]